MQTAEGKLYLFVAIDRTSKFAFVKLVDKANRVTAPAFLTVLVKALYQGPEIVTLWGFRDAGRV